SSLHFAKRVVAGEWDLILASEFLNLAEMLALLPVELRGIPSLLYFHENQLTYPLQEHEERDYHFALTHLHGMMVAERVIFNSEFHRRSLWEAFPEVLNLIPDVSTEGILEEVWERTLVLPLGLDFPAGKPRPATAEPVILWNHRWEYDKNPREFLEALQELQKQSVKFRLKVLGESFRTVPSEFAELKKSFPEELEVIGFIPDREGYLRALASSDIVISTAHHEFFGLGTLEAIHSGALPVLPDDLAYPELLPLSGRERYLYPRGDGLAWALERAIRVLQNGLLLEERRALLEHSRKFLWEELAPRYDAVFDEVVK
ncbi:MAG: DUF3524 domain-containing protein, partial [Planctomycetota bacterium]